MGASNAPSSQKGLDICQQFLLRYEREADEFLKNIVTAHEEAKTDQPAADLTSTCLSRGERSPNQNGDIV
ncbi:hypothetical protein ANN_08404 [Periplaneta americana]|uniref:Uncharacterized protein n=1 Tax=Periplaneta americana TaxID=6978 RepID=A0ABQ8T3J4_PERAM|nr:hypothetical protein ANN_08404 [Periplaneta americana]